MEDVGTIIAIVGSAIAIIAAMISLFLWLRSEANADRRHFQDIAREDRKDLISLHRNSEEGLSEHRKEMFQVSRNIENAINAMQLDMKDFHLRLLDIERKRGTS